MHSIHFIYCYMVTTQRVREKMHHRHYMGHSFRLATRVLLYTLPHRQDSNYHILCYTSRGALSEMSKSSMGDRSNNPQHHELMFYKRYISLRHEYKGHTRTGYKSIVFINFKRAGAISLGNLASFSRPTIKKQKQYSDERS